MQNILDTIKQVQIAGFKFQSIQRLGTAGWRVAISTRQLNGSGFLDYFYAENVDPDKAVEDAIAKATETAPPDGSDLC